MEGYETGEHAPGLKLRGSGAYRAAHHIIKVQIQKHPDTSREAEPQRYTVLKLLGGLITILLLQQQHLGHQPGPTRPPTLFGRTFCPTWLNLEKQVLT